MRVGTLEGIGVVYDAEGNPILANGERVLRKVREDNISVSEGSGIWNMKSHFSFSAEKGDFFLTNKRILFLRQPDPFLAAKDDAYPLGLPDAVAKAYRSHNLKKRNAKEFCEIQLSEVEGYWVKKRTCGIIFLVGPPGVTRKAVLYQRGPDDDKLVVLKSLLSARLPETRVEDRSGSFVLGRKLPLARRRR